MSGFVNYVNLGKILMVAVPQDHPCSCLCVDLITSACLLLGLLNIDFCLLFDGLSQGTQIVSALSTDVKSLKRI